MKEARGMRSRLARKMRPDLARQSVGKPSLGGLEFLHVYGDDGELVEVIGSYCPLSRYERIIPYTA
jgi:hypothetical protein